jgi:hypothetical protein
MVIAFATLTIAGVLSGVSGVISGEFVDVVDKS